MKESFKLMGEAWYSVLAWCLPERCTLCRTISPAGFCPACRQLLPWIDIGCEKCGKPVASPGTCLQCMGKCHSIDHGLVSFHYESPISDHIQMLKYREQLHVARSLGKALAQCYIKSGQPRPDAIAPVPLHPGRYRRRGFNQSGEISRILGDELGIKVCNGLLYRCIDTPSQTGLDASGRTRNVRGCFGANPLPTDTHVAVVDDVVTSGSTMREAAKTLKQAGVGVVSAWAVAATRRVDQ